MNKKGFTLVELLAVFGLLAIIAVIAFPNMKNLVKNNNDKQFTTYEKLMVDFAKTFPIDPYQKIDHFCLSELGMTKIKEEIDCNGYVAVNGKTYVPYLECSQGGQRLWKTKVDDSDEWTLPSDCRS